MFIPYERIVQWTAGPISIGAGWGATWLEANVGVLHQFPKAGVAKGITEAATFAVGAGVTYMAHHKWLDNLSKWWTVLPVPGVLAGAQPESPEAPSDIDAEVNAELVRMTAQSSAATQIQQSGTSPADVAPEHALSPTPVDVPVPRIGEN